MAGKGSKAAIWHGKTSVVNILNWLARLLNPPGNPATPLLSSDSLSRIPSSDVLFLAILEAKMYGL
jgi:hypothetical protein